MDVSVEDIPAHLELAHKAKWDSTIPFEEVTPLDDDMGSAYVFGLRLANFTLTTNVEPFRE